MTLSSLSFARKIFAGTPPYRKRTGEECCILYRAINSMPDLNISKLIDLMGGIEKLIGSDDIVVIKPNVQWWNQGAPNLSSLKRFIELIMERSGGFQGEVVIAENCHRGKSPWTSMSSGWAQPFQLNSDIPGIDNFNDLCVLLKKKYDSRFSVVHWIDVDDGGRRVFSPQDGDGYVYCDGTRGVPLIKCDNEVFGEDLRETIMTYPIFTTDKGTVVDFKNGVWEKGLYTEQPLRFINFSALNHHGIYCGATSAIKNYMGISDLSGGPDPNDRGVLTKKYYNFHSFPFDKWASGPKTGMLGKEVGTFMKTIRKADLNITTAEWVGMSSRVDPPVSHTRAVLACADPVALDYHATKYILYPNSKIPIHNPDNKRGPLHQYLMKCAESGDSVIDEEKVRVISYDFKKGAFQKDNELLISGEKTWGNSLKDIGKYLTLRYLI